MGEWRRLTAGWAALALSGGLLWAALAAAAEPTGRIGFFDLERVLAKSGIEREARKEFESRLEARKGALEAGEREFDQRRERLKLEGSALSPERRTEQESAIDQKLDALKRDRERYQQELNALDRISRIRVTRTVAQTVKDVGQEQGFAAILEAKQIGLYYVQQGLDLTDAIVQRIKEKLEAARARRTPPGDTPSSTGGPGDTSPE